MGAITNFLNAIGTITTLSFWERAAQMLLAAVMVGAGGFLLFRRDIPIGAAT